MRLHLCRHLCRHLPQHLPQHLHPSLRYQKIRKKRKKAKRVAKRVATCWGRQRERMNMVASAYIPKIIDGTELTPTTRNERISARGGCSKAMWGDKFWLRSLR